PDPTTIQELFQIPQDYRADPGQTVSGAAVEGLRTLFSMLEEWRNWLTNTIGPDQSLTDTEVKSGVPKSVSEAQSLLLQACQETLWVLDHRSEQRQQLRLLGKAKAFTTADFESIRLRRRISGELTPVPDRIQLPTEQPSPKQPRRHYPPLAHHPITSGDPSLRLQKIAQTAP